MIRTKKDLKRYLASDRLNNGFGKRKVLNPIKTFLTTLRKAEYHINNKHFFRSLFYRFRYRRLQYRYLTFIPFNSCEEGLSIGHLGCIYINPSAKIGKNCRIHEMVNIGATGGSNKAPHLGDNIYIGSGAKIIGEIMIANNVVIGAGAVVVKDINEHSTTWAGVPAKKISNNDSKNHIPVLNKK